MRCYMRQTSLLEMHNMGQARWSSGMIDGVPSERSASTGRRLLIWINRLEGAFINRSSPQSSHLCILLTSRRHAYRIAPVRLHSVAGLLRNERGSHHQALVAEALSSL